MGKTAKAVVFLENGSDALSFISGYGSNASLSSAVLYAFDKDAEAVLMKHGMTYKVPEQVITFSDYSTIDRDAMRFAKTWHTDGRIAEALSYGGIPLGGLIQRDMSFFISNVLDGIILSREVIAHETPDTVYIFKRDIDKAAHSIKAGPDETYYGYFAGCFAKDAVELESAPSMAADERYPERLYINGAGSGLKADAKNILWVQDFDYLDVAPELEASLGRRYNLKYLNKNAGSVTYDVKAPGAAIDFDDSRLKGFFKYDGVDFFGAMRPKFDYLKRTAFPRLAALCETVKRILAEEKIDCVMAAEDAILFNKSIVSAARSAGIRSVVLQKGACCHDISFVPVTADNILVWGKAASDYLAHSGVGKEKVVITGSLRFQGHKKTYGAERQRILDELGLGRRPRHLANTGLNELGLGGKYGKLFLMTMQHGNRNSFFRNVHIPFREELEVVKLLVRTMEHFPEDILYIKFHPQDEIGGKIFDFIDGGIGNNIRTIHRYPIERLLGVADVLITCFSTTALEALLMDIPVVVVNLSKRPFTLDYAKEDVAKLASSEDELVDALRAVRSENPVCRSAKDRFLAYHFYENNRHASRDITTFIDNMLSPRSRRQG